MFIPLLTPTSLRVPSCEGCSGSVGYLYHATSVSLVFLNFCVSGTKELKPIMAHSSAPAPRTAACLDDEEGSAPTLETSLPEFLLARSSPEHIIVQVFKAEPTTRIGISLRADVPDRAIVHVVARGTPAAAPDPAAADGGALVEPFDEILAIGGTPVESAVHAVKLIREAPEGPLELEKVACPTEIKRSVSTAQNALRASFARKHGLARRVLHKESIETVLGLSFSPDFSIHSVVRFVREGALAATALQPGDCIRRLNGVECIAPADTARMLRETSGRIELLVLPAHKVDLELLHAAEEREEARQRAERPPTGGYDDDDYEEDGEEEYDEEEEGYGDGERGYPPRSPSYPPRAAAVAHDPFPSRDERPAKVSVPVGGARRLPPSLGSLSPSPNAHAEHVARLAPAPTTSTRAGGPPLAAGSKPQGWREWLQQRRAMNTAVTKPAADPDATNQRV